MEERKRKGREGKEWQPAVYEKNSSRAEKTFKLRCKKRSFFFFQSGEILFATIVKPFVIITPSGEVDHREVSDILILSFYVS